MIGKKKVVGILKVKEIWYWFKAHIGKIDVWYLLHAFTRCIDYRATSSLIWEGEMGCLFHIHSQVPLARMDLQLFFFHNNDHYREKQKDMYKNVNNNVSHTVNMIRLWDSYSSTEHWWNYLSKPHLWKNA